MSVRVMTWVWEHSRAEGLHRLVLLAIADSADDTGANAWPSVATIAAKCRISERTVQRTVQALADDGQLEVAWNAGPRGTNRFRVVMTVPEPAPSEPDPTTPSAEETGPDPRPAVTPMPRRRASTRPPSGSHPRRRVTPDRSVGGGVTAVSPEPSLRPSPPQPPASGGSVCTRHSRPRSGCADCATPKPVPPPWCGHCDQTTRLVETSATTAARCPTCHPLTRAATRRTA